VNALAADLRARFAAVPEVAPERDFDPNQPRDPTGKWGFGGGPPGAFKPGKKPKADLTDAEYEAHTEMIEQRTNSALEEGLATDHVHTTVGLGGTGEWGAHWSFDRAQQHKEIVNDLYAKAENVPNEGHAVVAGGLGGSGKSTVLKTRLDPKDYLTLNPDDIKEEMISRGMAPEVEGLSPMESAALIHEESSHIANLLAKRAYADKKNVIWDITMSSSGSVKRRMQEMRVAGYDDMQVVFVDIPVETSVDRALARHRRGMERYRRGEGNGGRYVPPWIIRGNASAISSSANRDVFDDLRRDFDGWSLYDNSGTAPQKIAEG